MRYAYLSSFRGPCLGVPAARGCKVFGRAGRCKVFGRQCLAPDTTPQFPPSKVATTHTVRRWVSTGSRWRAGCHVWDLCVRLVARVIRT